MKQKDKSICKYVKIHKKWAWLPIETIDNGWVWLVSYFKVEDSRPHIYYGEEVQTLVYRDEFQISSLMYEIERKTGVILIAIVSTSFEDFFNTIVELVLGDEYDVDDVQFIPLVYPYYIDKFIFDTVLRTKAICETTNDKLKQRYKWLFENAKIHVK